MNSFIQIIFWAQLLSVVILAIQITRATYPRIKISTIGIDIFSLLLNAFFTAWSWNLLWGSH